MPDFIQRIEGYYGAKYPAGQLPYVKAEAMSLQWTTGAKVCNKSYIETETATRQEDGE